MVDFKDRIVTYPNRYRIGDISGVGENIKDLLSVPGEVITAGTALNRDTFMALQGYEPCTTEFPENGNVINIPDRR